MLALSCVFTFIGPAYGSQGDSVLGRGDGFPTQREEADGKLTKRFNSQPHGVSAFKFETHREGAKHVNEILSKNKKIELAFLDI